MGRSSASGPVVGALVPLHVSFGGNAGVIDATHTVDTEMSFPCRIMAISSATSAAKAGSPTFLVSTTTGAVLTATAVPSNVGVIHDISGAATANRDLAVSEQIIVTYTDVGGSTTATGFNVLIVLLVTGFPWTDGATDDEAND